MMYDPCTCLTNSKLNIVSKMISTAQINLEGSITGDIHTKNVGGKAQVQKSGSFGWKEFGEFVTGKVSTIHGSIDRFRGETQKLAENFGRVDTAGKKLGLANFASFLKDNRFLKAGFNSVPWLKGVISMFDVFAAGGKTTPPGPQEVKLLPMAVNLTAKLNGTLEQVNFYHNIKFTNPGSKDAASDPDNYPYYNEVLGVFNLLQAPVMYNQRYVDDITNHGGENYGTSVFVNKYHFLLDSLRYVLNPAAGVTIQNMQVAMLVEATPNYNGICGGAVDYRHIPDMYFEGRDAVTDAYKFRTDYYDVKCFNERVFETVSYFGRSTPASGLLEAACWLPDSKLYLKFMINLRRNNTSGSTQNVLHVVTFPMNLKKYDVQGNFIDNQLCVDSSIVAPATTAMVNLFCNSSVYNNDDRLFRVPSGDSLRAERLLQKNGIAVYPNPGNGQFVLRMKPQSTTLQSITIMSMSGSMVFKENIGNASLANGLTKKIAVNLPSGMYVLNCSTTNGLVKTRLIIQ